MILHPLTRVLLYVPAKLYELGVRTRIALYQGSYLQPARLKGAVISIGNLTVGGTGKTPLVAFLARYLQDEGHHVAILSRGYRRTSRGVIEVSDGDSIQSNPAESGDEPFLLARSCPGVRVVVGKQRALAGAWLEERATVSVFLLDDGYQHLALDRDLNIVLIDASDPRGGGAMMPFGTLREPLTSLRRADAVIVTRSDHMFDQNAMKTLIATYCRAEVPIFYGYHDVTALQRLDEAGRINPIALSRRRVAVMSGIGRPGRFRADLEHFGMNVVFAREFEDHHRYSEEEVAEVIRGAQAAGAEALVMTEKDMVNLPAEGIAGGDLPIYAAEIEFRCEEEAALKALTLRVATKTPPRP
ncbi:MAG: tetraacyldisaccharide 4'-kinase [Acidobacteriota bacterium]